MLGCPFYGQRWPERSPQLTTVGGNECGLDLEKHGPCAMEMQGRHVDYFACPIALERRGVLEAARKVIRFEDGQTLSDWQIRARL